MAADAPATPQPQMEMKRKSRTTLMRAAVPQPMSGAFISFTANETPTAVFAPLSCQEKQDENAAMHEPVSQD